MPPAALLAQVDPGDVAETVAPFLIAVAIVSGIGVWAGRQQRRKWDRSRRHRGL